MEEIPEVYNLETVEQLRAIADPLRLRIVDALSQRALTATMLGETLGLPANKAHYHARELEKAGLAHIVETREKGGILEKYYRAVARSLNVPGTLLQAVPPDDSIVATRDVLQFFTQEFMRAFTRALRGGEWEQCRLTFAPGYLWMTDEEYKAVMEKAFDLFSPYRSPRGLAGEREHDITVFTYDTALARDDGPPRPETEIEAATPLSPDSPQPRDRRTMAAGAFSYARRDLEDVVARGERLDLNIVGVVAFADDIPADLVDRAIARFRHRGVLRASPAVRDALKSKEV